MFAKLLKYDMKSTMRIGLPLVIAGISLIVVGVLNGLFSAFIADLTSLLVSTSSLPDFIANSEALSFIIPVTLLLLSLLSSFFDVIITLVLSALIIATVVINLVNFYKSLVTDEGYLTFTLPVSPMSILTSKVVNAAVWDITVGAISLGGVLITRAPNFIYTIVTLTRQLKEIDPQFSIWDAIKSVIGIDGISPLNIVFFLFVVVLFYLLLIIALQTFMFFTVFLGGVVAKKRKFLASAGFTVAGYATYYVLEQTLALTMIIACLIPAFFIEDFGAIVVADYMLLILNTILFLSCIVSVVAFVIFFILTKLLMTRKLNLP